MSIRDRAQKAKPGVQVVPVPEWDCSVEIRAMSANEASDFMERRIETTKGKTEEFRGFWASLIVATAHDPETGKLAFDQEGDAEMLNGLEGQAAVISRLGMIAAELCGLSKAAQEKAGKDSSGTPDEGPTSP